MVWDDDGWHDANRTWLERKRQLLDNHALAYMHSNHTRIGHAGAAKDQYFRYNSIHSFGVEGFGSVADTEYPDTA